MKNITNTIILAVVVAALAALLLAGCQNGSNKELPQTPSEGKDIRVPAPIDTSKMDEKFYKRMWELEALHPSSPSDK